MYHLTPMDDAKSFASDVPLIDLAGLEQNVDTDEKDLDKQASSPTTRGGGTPSTANGDSPSRDGTPIEEFPEVEEHAAETPKIGIILRSLLRVTKKYLGNEV